MFVENREVKGVTPTKDYSKIILVLSREDDTRHITPILVDTPERNNISAYAHKAHDAKAPDNLHGLILSGRLLNPISLMYIDDEIIGHTVDKLTQEEGEFWSVVLADQNMSIVAIEAPGSFDFIKKHYEIRHRLLNAPAGTQVPVRTALLNFFDEYDVHLEKITDFEIKSRLETAMMAITEQFSQFDR